MRTNSHSQRVTASGCVQLELGNMVKTGELIQLWDVACQTNLQFNLVRRAWRDCLW